MAPQTPTLGPATQSGEREGSTSLRLWLVDFESLLENAAQLRLGPRMPLPGGHRGEVPGGMACGQSSSHS